MKSVLLQDWKFLASDATDAFSRDFDDNPWADVVVPHDWSVTFPFSREHSSGTGYLPGGTGWYRAWFPVPGDTQTALLTFDGVYKNAQVWVNGYYLGKRPNGYVSFTLDISPFIRKEGDNLVAVKVTHTDIADSRWFTGSGIYRKVKLTTHNGAYVPVESIAFTYDGAYADIKARVEGAAGAPVVVSLGEETWSVETSGDIHLRVRVNEPRLWSVDEPNLYTLAFASKGRPLCEPIRVGFRTFRFDADTGFSLNGVPMKIKGVCVHHDAGCLGAAVWGDVWRRRLEKLKNMGCNAIRTSHNPHMPELYDLCDEMGFLVMDEAFDEWEGCKNKWVRGHNVYPPAHQGYAEEFPQWHERDLTDLILRDRNHASVIMWSVGNEVDYPNDPYVHPLFAEMTGNNDVNKPACEMVYNDNKPCADRLAVIAKRLAAIVRRYDNTRPVLAASAFPELSSQIGFFDAFDLIGYNYKEHLYARDHERFPKLPLLGSENAHSEEAWLAVRDNEYISAQFLWTGVDFLGEAKGWPVRGSRCGLLDLAGNEKPAYYERSAMWGGTAVDVPADLHAKAERISLSVWRAPSVEGRYGVYQVEVSILDENGSVCRDNASMLTYTVGNGKLLGIENGDVTDWTEYAASYRRVYRGRAVAYVLVEANATASLSVSGEGFSDVEIRLGL